MNPLGESDAAGLDESPRTTDNPSRQPTRPQVHRLDERGRLCPMPVIALGHVWQRAQTAGGAHRVDILVDDPAAAIDIPAWCRMKGARVAERVEDGRTLRFVIDL